MPSNFKIVNLSDPGSSIQFGADDLDKVNHYFNGDDLGITIPIDTETKYSSNKLAIADNSGDFQINIKTSDEPTSSHLTIPPLNGIDQEIVTSAAGQILTNKSINALSGGNNITGITDTNIDNNAQITWSKINKAFSKIGDLADTSIAVSPTVGDAIVWNGTSWVNAAVAGGGGGGSGEVNTASNVGSAGIGIFKQKTLYNLEFKKIRAASTKLTITDDTANSKIDLDVNLSAALLSDFGGSITSSQITAGAVNTAALGSASVTLAKMAADSVDSSKIVDLSITNSDISNTAAIAWTKLSKTGSSIDDLADVSITSLLSNQVLTWNGSTWVNQTPDTSGSSSTGWSPVGATTPKWGMLTSAIFTSTEGVTGTGICNSYFVGAGNGGSAVQVTDLNGTGFYLGTGTTINGFGSIDSRVPYIGSPYHNPKFWAKFRFSTTSGIRWFIGYISNLAIPLSNNQLGGLHGAGFKYDSSVDSSIKFVTNNGQTTQTTYNLSITPVANSVYNVSVAFQGSGGVGANIAIAVNSFSTTVSTNIPPVDQWLGWSVRNETLNTTDKALSLYYAYLNIDV